MFNFKYSVDITKIWTNLNLHLFNETLRVYEHQGLC